MDKLAANPLKFILFIDDLSFTANDDNFAALKALLEGSVGGRAKNIAVYATSNRRQMCIRDRCNTEGRAHGIGPLFHPAHREVVLGNGHRAVSYTHLVIDVGAQLVGHQHHDNVAGLGSFFHFHDLEVLAVSYTHLEPSSFPCGSRR